MKKTIIFVDGTYPEAYDDQSIGQKALGGTEASVIRIAQILSKKHQVLVLQQHRRHITQASHSLCFSPLSSDELPSADVVVVLRKYPLAINLRAKLPDARIFLWIHTYKSHEYVLKRPGLAKHNIDIICNSKTHLKDTDKKLNSGIFGRMMSLFCRQINVQCCYNPIPEPNANIMASGGSRDLNKLVFLSSPNKGLAQTLACFEVINRTMPDLRLYVANPGYKQSDDAMVENTHVLGSLPHLDMMTHLNQALCVFYPQDSFAETFGLIYAEANAYGTPVLAHDIGAAREILDPNNPLIDVNEPEQVLQLIKQWQLDFPSIKYNASFNVDNIEKQWSAVLFSPDLTS